MERSIVITGGAGYIGSVATYLFLQKGYRVVVVDNLYRGYREPMDILSKKFGDRFSFVKRDLVSDPLDDIFEDKSIGAVVHYGALCLVDESVKQPWNYFRTNVCGTNNLLEAMVAGAVKNIVFSSTCAVYGEAEYVPVDEKHPTVPSNPYGESKLMVEKMIEWYARLKDIRYVILRYFNVCGASDDGEIGDSKKPSVLLMQNAVRGALGIEPFKLTCPKVDTPDGTPIRDYVNVVDLNSAHLAAVEYLFNGGESDKINLGTGSGHSVMEIVCEVQKITGVAFDMGRSDPRQGEYAKMIAKIEKAEKVLGWKPKRTIGESVQSLVKWYNKFPHGWER